MKHLPVPVARSPHWQDFTHSGSFCPVGKSCLGVATWSNCSNKCSCLLGFLHGSAVSQCPGVGHTAGLTGVAGPCSGTGVFEAEGALCHPEGTEIGVWECSTV